LIRRRFLFTSLASLAPLSRTAAASGSKVVVFLAAQWRGLATPWARDPDLIAPNLEKFAKESLVYTRAYSACPAAGNGRESLLKGQFPPVPADVESPVTASVSGVAAAVDFLEKNRSKGFFLVVDAALPANAPARFDAARLHPRLNVPSDSEPKMRPELARYYNSLAALDEEFGRLLAGLATLKLDEGTMLLFTSDRGAQIGSHGLDGDDAPYEESVRVPVAIRFPRRDEAGVATDTLLSHVDLLPLLRGDVARVPGSTSVFVKGALGKREEWRVVVRGYDKLVVAPTSSGEIPITHLYNLADDPYELTNLAHDPAAQLTRDNMTALTHSWMRKVSDRMDPSGLKKRN
jgi:arylsulfatase A-like enzyme